MTDSRLPINVLSWSLAFSLIALVILLAMRRWQAAQAGPAPYSV